MKIHRIWFAAVVSIPLTLSLACGGAGTSHPTHHQEEEIKTEISNLRDRADLPEGVKSVRYAGITLGDGFLGPTDVYIAAAIELSPKGVTEIETEWGRPRTLEFPAQIMQREAHVLPKELLLNGVDADGYYLLPNAVAYDRDIG